MYSTLSTAEVLNQFSRIRLYLWACADLLQHALYQTSSKMEGNDWQSECHSSRGRGNSRVGSDRKSFILWIRGLSSDEPLPTVFLKGLCVSGCVEREKEAGSVCLRTSTKQEATGTRM